MEDHDQIDVEFNLEFGVDVGGARVRIREQHVKRNLKIWQNIAISHLDVLNLSCVSLPLKSLHTHELDLN